MASKKDEEKDCWIVFKEYRKNRYCIKGPMHKYGFLDHICELLRILGHDVHIEEISSDANVQEIKSGYEAKGFNYDESMYDELRIKAAEYHMNRFLDGIENIEIDRKQAFEKDSIGKYYSEIRDLVNHPRSLIVISHGFVELMINTLALKKLKNGKKISKEINYTHSIKLVILNEAGIISDDSYKILNWFRGIRNKATHETEFKFDITKIPDYVKRLPGNETNLYWLIDKIVVSLWNAHGDTFSENLAPNLKAYFAEKQRDSGNRGPGH